MSGSRAVREPGLEGDSDGGTIAVHEFITLDGVIEAPSWSFDYPYDPTMGEAIGAIMGSSKAILLGRRTYQEFAPAWSGRTAGEDPGAVHERITQVRRLGLAAGRRLAELDDLGPLPRGGDPRPEGPGRWRHLRQRQRHLVRALLADGLVDELHLFMFPLVHGAGKRLFADTGPAIKLALAGSQAHSNGALHLTYRPAT